MSDLTLYIGNRNYSSWSLRPWILLKHLGLAFQEVLVPLDQPGTKADLGKRSPSGRVPVLQHGTLCVWESIAICEYLAELSGRGWPRETQARAVARSVSAEMHSSFMSLRSKWPMNARARNRQVPMTPEVAADLRRIEALWTDSRARFGSAGPWLFGEYSIADAMYAPIVLRFNTYGAHVGATAQAYMSTVLADPALQEWLAAAQAEPWTIKSEEVGQ